MARELDRGPRPPWASSTRACSDLAVVLRAPPATARTRSGKLHEQAVGALSGVAERVARPRPRPT